MIELRTMDMNDNVILIQDYRQDLSISDSIKDCVSRKISIIAHEHPEMEHKQVIAIAYSYCRKGQDFVRQYTPEDILDMMDAIPVPNAPGAVGGPMVRPMRTLAEAVRAAGSPVGAARKSSNIQKIGYFNSMLEVEFRGGRRYVYFVGPDFYERMVEAPSKGKFLWKELRGKRPGLVFDNPNKITPGGVPAEGVGEGSLVPYSKGTGGTPEISTLRPTEVARIPEQSQLELLRKELEIGLRGTGLKWSGISERLPSGDFTMTGFLTRSGKFDYGKSGIKKKKWANIKERFMEIEHLPVFGSKAYDSHGESYNRLIGYAIGPWEYIDPGVIDKDGHLKGDIELFEDIKDLSDLDDPNELPVSLGFVDIGEGEYQNISKLRHIAVSLNKFEADRCSSAGGMSCNISTKKSEGRDTNDLHTKERGLDGTGAPTIKNYKKGEKKMGEKETEDLYEDGTGTTHDRNPETKMKEELHLLNISSNAANAAYEAVKGGGEQGVKKVKQDPSTYDMVELDIEEYADLIASAKAWKENKDFLETLKAEREDARTKEMAEIKEYLINVKKISEDFLEERAKTICDLKLIKATLDINSKEQSEPQGDDMYIQEVNTQRILGDVSGVRLEDDFAKQEEQAKQQALVRFFPNKAN